MFHADGRNIYDEANSGFSHCECTSELNYKLFGIHLYNNRTLHVIRTLWEWFVIRYILRQMSEAKKSHRQFVNLVRIKNSTVIIIESSRIGMLTADTNSYVRFRTHVPSRCIAFRPSRTESLILAKYFIFNNNNNNYYYYYYYY